MSLTSFFTRSSRRFLIPEVVQTSMMDCGPASLKALLEGFHIPVNYGRLREACQTSVDGTSIDVLEQVANQLGLVAEQVMMSPELVLLPASQSLPALVVVDLPDGNTHFNVLWRQAGPYVQVMDPAVGRRWMKRQQFLDSLHIHTQPIPLAHWLDVAASPDQERLLKERMLALRIGPLEAQGLLDRLLNRALSSPRASLFEHTKKTLPPDWWTYASLDAVLRCVDALLRSRAIKTGTSAVEIIEALMKRLRSESLQLSDPALFSSPDASDPLRLSEATRSRLEAVWQWVPRGYWSVLPALADGEGNPQVMVSGAVMVIAAGTYQALGAESQPELSPELSRALNTQEPRPLREVLSLLNKEEGLVSAVLVASVVLVTITTAIEVLLFRGLLDLAARLGTEQRLVGWGMFLLFMALMALLEYPIAALLNRLGRQLELGLRMAFLAKIPRLPERYFSSRPVSDMATRSHMLHSLRGFPELLERLLRGGLEVGVVTAGLVWMAPSCLVPALLAALVSVGLPMGLLPLLGERSMRVETHRGALSRYYLDAMLGLMPLRTHGAGPALTYEHDQVLAAWQQSALAYQRFGVLLAGLQSLLGVGLSAWLVVTYWSQNPVGGGLLLFVWWALRLPALGQNLAGTLLQYPVWRAHLLRLLEPLGAEEEPEDSGPGARGKRPHDGPGYHPSSASPTSKGPVSIQMQNVSIQAGGHTLLQEVSLEIDAGSHVAIVGVSGAGKSSLLGLLLGWHRPASGTLRVEGETLTPARLALLRQDTAWVDPAVMLWNRSLLHNLRYGAEDRGPDDLSEVITRAQLKTVLERLPDGLQTPLGEGGGLVSGGEGQRVRLARAFMRPNARLVLLDEPFRGLDRAQRSELLQESRTYWQNATILCVTHDILETRTFPRVLVIEDGMVVEDGDPAELSRRAEGRYRALLEAEQSVQNQIWDDATWRKLTLDRGALREEVSREETSPEESSRKGEA